MNTLTHSMLKSNKTIILTHLFLIIIWNKHYEASTVRPDISPKIAIPFQMVYFSTIAQHCLLLSSNRIVCCLVKFHTTPSKQDKARHRRRKLVSKLLPREDETYSALSFDIQLPGEIVVSSSASLRSFAPPILRLSLLAQPVNVRHSI